jgi:cell fate (sporulation/competence/biofilm development) regulator YlbF (YheA/YmcA/DUF963 family)
MINIYEVAQYLLENYNDKQRFKPAMSKHTRLELLDKMIATLQEFRSNAEHYTSLTNVSSESIDKELLGYIWREATSVDIAKFFEKFRPLNPLLSTDDYKLFGVRSNYVIRTSDNKMYVKK